MRVLFIVFAVLLHCSVAMAQNTGVVYAPADAAQVRASEPTTPRPYNEWLQSGVGSSSNQVYRVFARFPLPHRGAIVSAVLKGRFVMYIGAGPRLHAFDFVSSDAWNPAPLTWNNQPAASSERIATLDDTTLSPFVDLPIDVTELARREQHDGWLSMRIAALDEVTLSGATNWEGREDTWSPGFRLEITMSPAPRIEPGDVVTLSYGGFYEGI